MNTQLKGGFLIIFSALFYASYGIWSKNMIGHFSEFSQAWTRGLIVAVFLLFFGLATKSFIKIKKQDLGWFLLICFCGALNQAPYFFGFEHLNVGTATLLFYVSLTLGAFVFGPLFFKEKITKIKIFSLAVASIGLVIIYRLSLTPGQIIPAIATMTAGLMGSAVVIFSKKLSGNYSETQILFWLFVLMFVANLVISSFLGEAMPAFSLSIPWAAQLAYCAAIVIANMAVIAGFRYLEPSVGGLLGLFEVLFAVAFGIVIFRDVMTVSTITGGILILIGASASDSYNLFKLHFHINPAGKIVT